MAFIFSLSTECGTLQKDAESFAKHFHQISWQMKSGVESKCNTGIFQDSEDNWWVRVYPSSVSQIGITTPEDAYQMTEFDKDGYWYKVKQESTRANNSLGELLSNPVLFTIPKILKSTVEYFFPSVLVLYAETGAGLFTQVVVQYPQQQNQTKIMS